MNNIIEGIKGVFSTANKSLFDAVKKDDYGEVKNLIDDGKITSKNINVKDKDGRTALMLAAAKENKRILEKIISVMSIDPSKLSKLIDEVDKYGKTALFYAANPEFVKLLIEKGAKVNAKDNNGQTALMWAAENGRTEIVNVLIKKGGVDMVDVPDKLGITAIMYAAEKGHTETVNVLVRIGSADVNNVSKYGKTALILAAQNGHTDTVKLLLELGATATINHGNDDGNTALILAAEKGHTSTVKLLLDYGATVDMLNDKDETALIIAAREGHTEIVKLLLDKRADVNSKNDIRNTALIYAASRGHTEIVKLLLDKGANISIRNRDGKTALYYAKKNEIKNLLNSSLGPLGNLEGVTIMEGAINDEDCSICLDQLKDGRVVVKTKCKTDDGTPEGKDSNHQFHAECLIDQKKRNRICPLCRNENAFFGQSRSSKRKSKKRRSMRRRSKRRSKFSASRQMDLRCPNRVRRRSRSKKLKKNVDDK